VLGMCPVENARHSYQQMHHRCLPFLWLLEKDQLRAAIRKLDQGGS